MKRFLVLVAGVCFILAYNSQAHAWFGKKKQQEAVGQEQQSQKSDAPVVAAPVEKKIDNTEKARLQAAKAQKDAADKKRKELENTSWEIELTPLSGALKGKKEAETVLFKGNQVSFVNYEKKGFPATNFTLTVQEDGQIVWETMQTSEKAGIAFWRGELPDMQNMRGIFSYHPDENTTIDYSFSSTQKRVVPPAGN